MSYDERCWQLAMVFVHEIDRPMKTRKELAHELAQKIQATIEEFISERTCNCAERGFEVSAPCSIHG